MVVGGEAVGSIGPGILTLLGVAKGDTEEQTRKTISKICNLRIFEDEQGKMNRSVKDIEGGHLIVSQFTLQGDCRQGRRPSFTGAEAPDRANGLYRRAIEFSREEGVKTAEGVFQAEMNVELVNDGPVTFVLEF